ncbi:MAG: hypothetical protein IPN34_09320 [Planctomycetes bacterium]|nr:hypothetical protein [Planctomycetota bacterium]
MRRLRSLFALAAIVLVARAVWLAPTGPQEEEPELAQARQSREALRACDMRLGLMMRSSCVFSSSGGAEQAVEARLFLSADGQLSQTQSARRLGSRQQILGKSGAWAASTTPTSTGELQTESGALDELGTHLLRARALVYDLALRFPWLGSNIELVRNTAADAPETSAWTCQREGVIARLRCDRRTGLPLEIAIDSAGLLVTCARWGTAPEGSRPASAPMPGALLWQQREPIPGPDVREELIEVQFEVSCPADLLEAQLGTPPGKRVDVDATRSGASVERWPIRLESDLAPSATFAADAAGFAALLELLRDAPIASLAPGPQRDRILAWQPSEGRFAILEHTQGAATFLERGSEGLAIHLHDPLGTSRSVGAELRGAALSHLLWAAAEEIGPEGRRYSSLRLGILR